MDNMIFNAVPIVVVVIFVIVVIVMIFSIVTMMSPKLRGKMMSRQIKAAKYMMDESKEDIRDISDNMADDTKDGIETTVRAIKKGIVEEDVFIKK